VQFAADTTPTRRDHQLLGAFLATRPDTEVRFYGSALPSDLAWLVHYSKAMRVTIDVDGVTSWKALDMLRPDLVELTLGPCGMRKLSLAPLRRFTELRELVLVRHHKDFEVLGELRSLERLGLISMTLPGLEALEPLTGLRAFELKLGGTTNLAALPRIGRLRYLEVWRVAGLTDLSVIGELERLEYLFLQHLKRVERLPTLASCRRLRRVHIDKVGIRDLAPIAAAPNLTELLLIDMPQLGIDAFRALAGHPSLGALTAGVRNEARREQIHSFLGLGDVTTYGTDFEFEGDAPAG
jgi:hypothetical protein